MTRSDKLLIAGFLLLGALVAATSFVEVSNKQCDKNQAWECSKVWLGPMAEELNAPASATQNQNTDGGAKP